jgi:hypothetical protein
MSRTRDDFKALTKRHLAERVGMRCSNPNCRCLTIGPGLVEEKSVSIGVAAHITAASKGGPRFDPELTGEMRMSIENAIWLCQNCASLIDKDVLRYEADLLRAWRDNSEEAARLDVGTRKTHSPGDREILQFFASCLDRPAFIDRFHHERGMEAFDRAIEDTVTALNTGTLRARDGTVLQTGVGKSYLTDPRVRHQITTVVAILRAIRSRYQDAKRTGEITVESRGPGSEVFIINSATLADWFDASRREVLAVFASAVTSAGLTNRLPIEEWERASSSARNRLPR